MQRSQRRLRNILSVHVKPFAEQSGNISKEQELVEHFRRRTGTFFAYFAPLMW